MFIQINQKRAARITQLAAAVTVLALVVSGCAAAPGDDVVRVADGALHGAVTGAVRSFAGIPYAAPPVGALRWQPPRPAAPWPGTRDATRPGNRCAQNASPAAGTAASASEDCLYLNVTTPRGTTSELPVLVYLHGGGLSSGAGSGLRPERLAAREHAVVVTPNYRLGVFGFFGHPGLPGSGTFGLQDQQAALRWVRRNIAAFGGNPDNTTLFGESGGGDSVCAQLVSPAARGLFAKALMQSGTCSDANPVQALFPGAPVASWQRVSAVAQAGQAVGAALGCPGADLACLRAVPVPRLLHDRAVATAYWSPAYDTPTLPVHPAQALAQGRFARVPTIIGTTSDEATLLVGLSRQAATAPAYRQVLTRAFGPRTDAVAAAYPAGAEPARSWAAVVGDRAYVCPNQRTATVLAGRVPTYAYEFADRDAPPIFGVHPPFPLGAYHASDVPYLWDGAPARLSPVQQQLSVRMLDYLGRFAATGNPAPRTGRG